MVPPPMGAARQGCKRAAQGPSRVRAAGTAYRIAFDAPGFKTVVTSAFSIAAGKPVKLVLLDDHLEGAQGQPCMHTLQ